MIEVKVVADSRNPNGDRLTTFVCTYPRFILAEVNTHRMLSRNSASSRAVPVKKMVEKVLSDPVIPVEWGKNQKGMQANELLPEGACSQARKVWLEAAINAVSKAEELLGLGVHKQIANRLLEPFFHITSIISGTEWGNFFNLRVSKQAQPEFRELARLMLINYLDSVPTEKSWGQWHLPFADKYVGELPLPDLIKVTVARCARVSYFNFERDIDHQKDFELHDRLLTDRHISPFEHAAYATINSEGNFNGWKQYRKIIKGENQRLFSPEALLEAVNATAN